MIKIWKLYWKDIKDGLYYYRAVSNTMLPTLLYSCVSWLIYIRLFKRLKIRVFSSPVLVQCSFSIQHKRFDLKFLEIPCVQMFPSFSKYFPSPRVANSLDSRRRLKFRLGRILLLLILRCNWKASKNIWKINRKDVPWPPEVFWFFPNAWYRKLKRRRRRRHTLGSRVTFF